MPVDRELFDPKDVPAELRQYFEEVETQCGAPWVRVVEREQTTSDGRKRPSPGNGRAHVEGFGGLPGRDPQIRLSGGLAYATNTTGWAPSCRCGIEETSPCVVLDPFLGKGTTALVADRLGRDAIGIDLSPKYCEMARKTIDSDAPLWSEPVSVETTYQPDLFAETAG